MNFSLANSNFNNNQYQQNNTCNPDICLKCGKRLYCSKWSQYLENYILYQQQPQQQCINGQCVIPQYGILQQDILQTQQLQQSGDIQHSGNIVNVQPDNQIMDISPLLDVMENLQKQVINLSSEIGDVKKLNTSMQEDVRNQILVQNAIPDIVRNEMNNAMQNVINNATKVVASNVTQVAVPNSINAIVPVAINNKEKHIENISHTSKQLTTQLAERIIPQFEQILDDKDVDNSDVDSEKDSENVMELAIRNPNEKPQYIVDEDGTTRTLTTNIFGREVYRKVKK